VRREVPAGAALVARWTTGDGELALPGERRVDVAALPFAVG
jgi:hypothetical protein